MEKPKPTSGLRHVALVINKYEDCERFYIDLLGMTIVWRPDENNVYLTSGNDNLALHRSDEDFSSMGNQHLDHIGFIVDDIDEIDVWHDYLSSHNVPIKTAPKMHRDGARSFYCHDPDGNTVQLIYHPLLV